PFTPPLAGRARSIALDPSDEARWWIGIEVGGVLHTENGGETWSYLLPGTTEVPVNPDIHTIARHPASGRLFASTGYGRIDQSEPRDRRSAGVFASDDGARAGGTCGPASSRATRGRCASIRARRTRSPSAPRPRRTRATETTAARARCSTGATMPAR